MTGDFLDPLITVEASLIFLLIVWMASFLENRHFLASAKREPLSFIKLNSHSCPPNLYAYSTPNALNTASSAL